MTSKRGPEGFRGRPEGYAPWTTLTGLGDANARRMRLALLSLPGFRPHAPKRNVIVALTYVYGAALFFALVL